MGGPFPVSLALCALSVMSAVTLGAYFCLSLSRGRPASVGGWVICFQKEGDNYTCFDKQTKSCKTFNSLRKCASQVGQKRKKALALDQVFVARDEVCLAELLVYGAPEQLHCKHDGCPADYPDELMNMTRVKKIFSSTVNPGGQSHKPRQS